MAIAYVGGATNSTGAGTASTLVITYTSTTSNALYLAILSFLGTTNITSVTDSASNAWTLSGGVSGGTAAANCGSSFLAWTPASSTGVTTVTIHATVATNICAVLGEYSGVTTVNVAGNVLNTGLATPVSTGVVTVVANNWMIAHMMAQTINALPVFTANTGNLRNQATMTLPAAYGFAGIALVDNTTAGTTLTDAANFSNTWLAQVAVSERAA